MPNRTLNDWTAGDPLKADHWQEVVDALKERDGAAAAAPGTPSPDRRKRVALTITNQGPSAEADWTNNAYWAKISYVAGGTQGADLAVNPDMSEYPPDDSGGTPAAVTVVAYNQAEEADGTHLLATDESVHVVADVIDDCGDPSRTRYLFDHAPAASKWAKLQEDPTPGASTVTAKPCSEDGTVPAGAPTISLAWGGTPPGTSSSKPPLYIPYASGDVVLYNPFPMSGGSLSLANPIAGVVHDIPIRGGALRSILQVTGVDGAGNPVNCGFDFLRSHNP